MNMTILENKLLLKYEDKEIGSIIFKIDEKNNTIDILETHVDSLYQGQGLAKKMMDELASYINKNNLKVIATCSYAKKYFNL